MVCKFYRVGYVKKYIGPTGWIFSKRITYAKHIISQNRILNINLNIIYVKIWLSLKINKLKNFNVLLNN